MKTPVHLWIVGIVSLLWIAGDALAMSGTAALLFTIAIPVILIALFLYARAMTKQDALR